MTLWALGVAQTIAASPVSIEVSSTAAPRVRFGVEKLTAALKEAGYEPKGRSVGKRPNGLMIVVGTRGKSPAIDKLLASQPPRQKAS